MQIDLNKLEVNDLFTYDEDFTYDDFPKDVIKDLKNLHLQGNIYYNSAMILEINLVLTGVMFISDSVTLEEIEHPFNIKINEEYSLNDPYFKEYYENEQNILDIMTILWENIILEVPMYLTKTTNVEISGDGWSLGGVKNTDEIDPRMARLAELLDKRKE